MFPGELDFGDCDFMKATLQNEGFGAALSVMLALLHRRQPRNEDQDTSPRYKQGSPSSPSSATSNEGVPMAQVSLPMAEAVLVQSLLIEETDVVLPDVMTNDISGESGDVNKGDEDLPFVYLPLPLVPPSSSQPPEPLDSLENAFSDAMKAVEFLESFTCKSDVDDDVSGGGAGLQTSAMLRGGIEAMEYFDDDVLAVLRNAVENEEIENEEKIKIEEIKSKGAEEVHHADMSDDSMKKLGSFDVEDIDFD